MNDKIEAAKARIQSEPQGTLVLDVDDLGGIDPIDAQAFLVEAIDSSTTMVESSAGTTVVLNWRPIPWG